MTYTVKQLSKAAGVSIRTLHYYDQIGLLKPSTIRENGYRQYGEDELIKLQQILFFKELDFPLEQIVGIMNSQGFDRIQALRDQKYLLEVKRKRLDRILETITKTIENSKGGENMNTNDMYGSFSDDEFDQYKEEVKQRWGHTKAYQQSQERVKNMTKEEMQKLKEDGKKFTQQIADSMSLGIASDEVQALIEKHYQSICFFYDCPLDMYKSLGQMYVDDPRFTATYESFAPGLALFMRDAIAYYVEQKTK